MPKESAWGSWALRVWAASCWGTAAYGLGMVALSFAVKDFQAKFPLPLRPALRTHMAASSVALGLMPFQLASQALPGHSNIGYAYFGAVALGGVSSLVATVQSPSALTATSGFFSLGVTWLFTAAMGLRAVLQEGRKSLPSHRNWMRRNMSLTFGAVTLRMMLTPALQFAPFEVVYPPIAWLAWVPNLMVTEALWMEDEEESGA